jgi:hypothetical protein
MPPKRAVPKKAAPKLKTLKQRMTHVDKVEAVHKLQQLHLDRRAAMLKAGLENEIGRLRGEMHTTAAYHTPHMAATVPKLVEELKKLKKKG